MLYLILLELIYLVSLSFTLMTSYRVEIFNNKLMFYNKYRYIRIRNVIYTYIYLFLVLTITVLTIFECLAII
jgi:hypothetical protein